MGYRYLYCTVGIAYPGMALANGCEGVMPAMHQTTHSHASVLNRGSLTAANVLTLEFDVRSRDRLRQEAEPVKNQTYQRPAQLHRPIPDLERCRKWASDPAREQCKLVVGLALLRTPVQ